MLAKSFKNYLHELTRIVRYYSTFYLTIDRTKWVIQYFRDSDKKTEAKYQPNKKLVVIVKEFQFGNKQARPQPACDRGAGSTLLLKTRRRAHVAPNTSIFHAIYDTSETRCKSKRNEMKHCMILNNTHEVLVLLGIGTTLKVQTISAYHHIHIH